MSRTDDPTRAALLDAAHHVLATEGPTALTVRHIAGAAGVSTMNVYSRFGGKDGVVDELFADGFRRLRASMEHVRDDGDPMAELRACGAAYREFALGNATYYAVMFQGTIPDFEPSEQAREVAIGAFEVLVDRVRRVMAAGAMAPDDPTLVAASIWSTCHGLVSLELAGAGPLEMDWAYIYEHTLDALVQGLAARGAGPGPAG